MTTPGPGGGVVGGGGVRSIIPAMASFKVLTECPLIVMLLFQLYPRFIQTDIPVLMPLMVSTLSLTARTEYLHMHKAAHAEFVAAQVKTLSFFTYLLKSFAKEMSRYHKQIPASVVELLWCCPADAVTTRKELLVATRHILATEFRVGFHAHIHDLQSDNL